MQQVDENSCKILIAAENIKYRDILATRLRMQGFAVEFASGGFHLLHVLERRHDFRLIILHENMHDMSAFEIISLIRTKNAKAELPVLFISAKGSEEEIRDMIFIGANEYILKSPNLQPIVDRATKYANMLK